ncbi:MAG: hypothetical protein H0X64_04025 [Gemmatimonadaceae bacterium]|nr:hypothetical protein [Gemmatimonadaceae bacterium]
MAYVRGGQQASGTAGTAGITGGAGTTRRPGDPLDRSPLGAIGQVPPGSLLDDDDEDFDWDRVGVFGAGIVLGALVGVAVTLFTAPLSGADARLAVRKRARHAVWTGRDAWEDLRDELATATARKKKQLRRRRRRVREVWDDGTLV